MTQAETNVWKDVQLSLSKIGARLFRNQRYKGPIYNSKSFADCGIGGDGGPDLIGWTPVEINGKAIAVFTALEAKHGKGQASTEQLNFINAVKKAGGIAGIVKSSEQAVALIKEFKDNCC